MAAEPDADPFDELSHEEKQELVDIVKSRRDDHISRRDVLKAAGLIGSGAVLGGGASAAALDATGQASAGSAEEGTLGTAADPLDIHIEDLFGPGGPITLQDNIAGNQQDISNLNSLTTGEINTLEEFYTPADGILHTVDESTLKSLMDNYDTIICPSEKSVTFSSTKSLDKANHDHLTLVCPFVQNPHRADMNGFNIVAGGDHSLISSPTTEDIGGLTFYGIGFDGNSNTTTGTELVSIGDGFVHRYERCKFTAGKGPGLEFTGDVINFDVIDCRFNTSDDSALHITGKIGKARILDNFFGEAIGGIGIHVDSINPDGVMIRGNLIRDTGGKGMDLDVTGNRLFVRGNQVVGAGNHGIHTRGTGEPIVFSNRIENCTGDGIRAVTRAMGNLVVGNDDAGINCNDGAIVLGNIILNNDQAGNGAAGVDINFDDDCYVAWNVIEDTQATATQEHGIAIANSSDTTVGPNRIAGHATGRVDDQGTRTVFGGQGGLFIGQNAGSPASGGDWNGNGRRGVIVEDTNNAGDAYIFLPSASAWSQIST